MSCNARKPVFKFPTRFDTNQAVQLQKIAFQIKEVEGLEYLCSKNIGAYQ